MSSSPTVLIVGGKLKIVEKAKRLGLRVLYLQHPRQFTPEHQGLVDAAILVDYTDWSVVGPLARGAYDAYGFGAVLSLTEPGLVPASRINDLLGLPGNPVSVSERLLDKWAMREHLAWAGTPTVAAALVDGRASLARFGRDHGYPFIVKPSLGTASVGVYRVDGPPQVDQVWHAFAALRDRPADLLCPVDTFVMEEYVDGPEYSVEAFSFDGRHVVVAVTEKLTAGENFVETGHAMPARLDGDLENGIVGCVVGFLDAVGLRHGPSHTEVRVGPSGPRVIESHNRVGGGRICELVETAYGIDLDEMALGWPFGLVPELHDRPVPRQAAATRFVLGGPGKVAEVDVPDAVRTHPAVVVVDVWARPGDEVGTPTGGWDRLGQVATSGPDTAAAIRACDELVNKITVSVE
jgi:hypothetical protein